MRRALQMFGDQMGDETFLLEPEYLDNAIVAVQQQRVVYDYSRLVEAFSENGMTHDEAVEWIDYNVLRAIPYMGKLAPIVMEDGGV